LLGERLKLIHISDTHGRHRELTKLIPSDTDILVHSGDWSHFEWTEETEAFLKWFKEMPGEHKILVSGNHDGPFSKSADVYSEFDLEGVHYLENQSIEIEGIKFYGSPNVRMDFEMSFTYFNDSEALSLWKNIPEDTEVLITHGPAHGTLDQNISSGKVKSFGCRILETELQKLKKLKLHLFGHVHEAKGVEKKNGVIFSNAATGIQIHQIH